jgi:hypothetical protein
MSRHEGRHPYDLPHFYSHFSLHFLGLVLRNPSIRPKSPLSMSTVKADYWLRLPCLPMETKLFSCFADPAPERDILFGSRLPRIDNAIGRDHPHGFLPGRSRSTILVSIEL